MKKYGKNKMEVIKIVSIILLILGIFFLVVGLLVLWALDVTDNFMKVITSVLLLSGLLLMIGAIIALSFSKDYNFEFK